MQGIIDKYSNIEPLTKEQQLELLKNKTPENINKLTETNIRFVMSLARLYKDKYHGDYEDLVHVGSIGLIKGIETFDISKGFSLTTHAQYWIKRSILRHIENFNSLIRIPVCRQDVLYKIARFMKSPENFGLGFWEIAEKEGLDKDKGKLSLRDIDVALNIQPLHSHVEGGTEERSDAVHVKDTMLDDIIHNEKYSMVMDKLLEYAETRPNGRYHAEVFMLYFGIHPDHKNRNYTYQKISKMVETPCSRQRIHQIVAKVVEYIKENIS